MGIIGKRIKEFALKNSESVKEFEASCGFSQGVVQRESNMRVDNLAKILELYPNLDVYWVLTGKKPNFNHIVSELPIKNDIMTEGEEYLKMIIQSQQAMIKAQQDTINTMMSMKGL